MTFGTSDIVFSSVSGVSARFGIDALDALGLSHAGGAVTIDFDKTLLVQAAFFLLLLVVLKPLLFDPMLKLFEEREKKTEGLGAQVGPIIKEAGELRGEYERQMREAQLEASAQKERLRSEGQKAEAELLGKTRGEVDARLDSGRQKNDAEATAVRAVLEAQIEEIATSLARQAIGRDV